MLSRLIIFYSVFLIAGSALAQDPFDALVERALEKNPEYYTPGIKDKYFNFPIFWGWFGSATAQSIFIALVA